MNEKKAKLKNQMTMKKAMMNEQVMNGSSIRLHLPFACSSKAALQGGI